MTHPKYQIVAINKKNGEIKSVEVVSKELMFKCDAERFCNYYNKNDATFNDYDNAYFFAIREYKKH